MTPTQLAAMERALEALNAIPLAFMNTHDDVTNVRRARTNISAALAEPAVQEPRNHVGNSSFESWYADYDPIGKGDKQRARDAYAAGMGDPVYLPAPVQEPVAWMVRNGCADYQLMGSKAQADALAAEMQKRYDLSGSLASFRVCPLYTAPQAQQPAPPADVPMLTEDEVEAVQEGIAVDDFAHDLVRRTERLVRQKAGLQ